MQHPRLGKYAHYLHQKFQEFGERKLITTDLAQQFVPYFETGERIKVRHGEKIYTGIVEVPFYATRRLHFLLIQRAGRLDTAIELGDSDQILAVKRGRTYVPLAELRWQNWSQASVIPDSIQSTEGER